MLTVWYYSSCYVTGENVTHLCSITLVVALQVRMSYPCMASLSCVTGENITQLCGITLVVMLQVKMSHTCLLSLWLLCHRPIHCATLEDLTACVASL